MPRLFCSLSVLIPDEQDRLAIKSCDVAASETLMQAHRRAHAPRKEGASQETKEAAGKGGGVCVAASVPGGISFAPAPCTSGGVDAVWSLILTGVRKGEGEGGVSGMMQVSGI